MSILVSGGAGYIGSHTCVELIQAGYDIVVADNLVNASEEAVRRVERIVGRAVPFVKVDLCDPAGVEALFAEYPDIDAVIHFAALKAVGESVAKPLEYYTNNLVNTLTVLNAMRRHGVKNFVFSSSATVYGDPHTVPIREDFPLSTTNPYGTTKLFIERILTDCCAADPTLNVALLRYFNPIGAHAPISPRWRLGSSRSSMCSAATGPPTTAPACGTTSMWWIWPAAMWLLSKSCLRTVDSSSATWAPARATACWTCSTPTRKPAASLCLTSSIPAAQGISPRAGPIRPRPEKNWAGRRSTALRRCARPPGSGRA